MDPLVVVVINPDESVCVGISSYGDKETKTTPDEYFLVMPDRLRDILRE
jgi:hypothetical protein